MRVILAIILYLAPSLSFALADHTVDQIVEEHVLPGYTELVATSSTLAQTATDDCSRASPTLQAAYHETFDAWITVSHLRFGPSELNNRAFSMAFWPDPRGKTPKALRRMISARDDVVDDEQGFAQISVAARGIYALERLLFDPSFDVEEDSAYTCKLVIAIARDIARTATDLLEDWRARYAEQMISAGRKGSLYRTPLEAEKELLTALEAGLETTSAMRLGRPMGTFDRPRPKRAEARLSGRSVRNVQLSLTALREMTSMLATAHPAVARSLDQAFANALEAAKRFESDPVFTSVATIDGRLQVEILKQSVERVAEIVLTELSPALGITPGFNALDGD
ncbi:MAG: imelysin family protein [Pseudomonadota bacterium]